MATYLNGTGYAQTTDVRAQNAPEGFGPEMNLEQRLGSVLATLSRINEALDAASATETARGQTGGNVPIAPPSIFDLALMADQAATTTELRIASLLGRLGRL